MNFISQDKDGSALFFKAFSIALVALGAVFFMWFFSPADRGSESRSSDSTPAASKVTHAAGAQGHQCDHGCNHGPATRPGAAAKSVTVKGAKSMYGAKPGDTVELDFGNELTVRGRVKVNKEVSHRRRAVTMNLLGQKGTVYWLEYEKGKIMGNVVLTKNGENQVYKFSGEQGKWLIQEIAFQDYVCASGVTDESVGIPVSDAPFTPSGVSAIIPLLNSRPSATACVYLDFDGETVSGTRWVNGGTINALEPGLTESQIRLFWEIVAEDMRPFDLNVTTDRAVFDAAPVNRRMHVIMTPTDDAQPGVGGVAYLNSFYDGSIDPCWVFVLDPQDGALAASHEVGHTFGLRHDGLIGQVPQEEYHQGNGSWGPIMGAPYGHDTVSWSQGDYIGSTNTEDDLAIISDTATNGFGYRTDDYGDANAFGFDLSGNTGDEAVDVLGVIETSDDVDVFSFTTSGGSATVTATPTSSFPNLNIRARLFDDAGNLVSESDPGATFSATVSTTLDAGVYHLHVEGVADGSPDVSGFNDYSSLGAFGLIGNISGLGGLIIDIVEPQLDDVSILEGNGLVLRATVVGEADSVLWAVQRGPLGGVATFYPNDELATRATFSQPGLYTLMFRAVKDGVASEATIRVSVEAPGDVQLFGNRGPAITVTSPEEFYSREGLLNGRALDDDIPVAAAPALEWVVVSGNAVIENPTAVSPLIRFEDSEPNVVALESSDGQIRTFKQITALSVYEAREVVKAGSMANWFIPRDNNLGLTWVAPAFPDGSWNTGPLGIGFNSNDDYNPFLNLGTNIKASMRYKSPSAYIRMPFVLPPLDYVQGLKLKINYDDGFVLYLNGVEVTRKNAPLGTLSWNSVAPQARSLQDVLIADEIDLGGFAAQFLPGENVLAIHGLNRSKGNRDFLIYPVLQADIVASPYLAFMELNGTDLAPYLDKDGDTLLNFVEHALRTNPNTPDAVNPLTPLTDGSVSVTLPEDMPQDVDYIIEKSVDMTNWSPIATKRGMADWTGDSVLVSVTNTAGGKVTFNIRQVTALPMSYYRMAYKLRGPVAPPTP